MVDRMPSMAAENRGDFTPSEPGWESGERHHGREYIRSYK